MEVKTRLLTPREGARLMGLPETYELPKSVTAAMHVIGDGVVVNVVAWISKNILIPLADGDGA
jgi:DNA (cytosine-5)-methyltransferase 1